MAKIIYSKQALNDLDRLADFLLLEYPHAALETIELIQEAVNILQHHSLIGREIDEDLKQLVISRGRSGYIALYSYEPEYDLILILGIRHQREAGFDSFL